VCVFVSHHVSDSFFFSSRRRHTRSKRDWSSDVCSSDLPAVRSLRALLLFTSPGDFTPRDLRVLVSDEIQRVNRRHPQHSGAGALLGRWSSRSFVSHRRDAESIYPMKGNDVHLQLRSLALPAIASLLLAACGTSAEEAVSPKAPTEQGATESIDDKSDSWPLVEDEEGNVEMNLRALTFHWMMVAMIPVSPRGTTPLWSSMARRANSTWTPSSRACGSWRAPTSQRAPQARSTSSSSMPRARRTSSLIARRLVAHR